MLKETDKIPESECTTAAIGSTSPLSPQAEEVTLECVIKHRSTVGRAEARDAVHSSSELSP